MPQSLVQIYVHIVFSTKLRSPFLIDSIIRERIHAYLAGICNNLGSPAVEVGGVADHVHILCRLGKTQAMSDLIRDLKRNSTNWIRTEWQDLHSFSWQEGYGAFSISPRDVEIIRPYIVGQEEHHRTISFQEELRRICAKYGVEIDERYAWD